MNSRLCVNSSCQNKNHSSSFSKLNVQTVLQCPSHEPKGVFSGLVFFFLCLRTKSSFIRQAWANGYKINTGQHFEAEKGEMSVGNCVISYYPDMARGRDCVVKGPFHATERKLSCKSAQRPSMCSEFWSQSGFYLEHFPSVWMRLKPRQMFYSSTQLSCLGFVLAHLGKFPGLRELPASSG